MSSERVTFPNCRGQTLVGALHGGVAPAMAISCHGMLSTKNGIKHQRIAQALQRRGVSVLRFDFAGRGESDGRTEEMTYSRQIEDLDAAISYLCSRGAERIGLFGSSMGGAVALLGAARDERVVAVATLAAVGHPAAIAERYPAAIAGWRERGYVEIEGGRIGRAFLDDALSHDVEAAMRVVRAPILVLHGAEDEVVPVADAHDIASAAHNATLEIIEGADHRFSNEIHLRPAVARICDFLAAQLGGVTGAAAPV